jgi:hypothetical protein
MPDRAPKVRRGEPRRASAFNRLRDFAASKLRLEVEPPLTLKPEGNGRVLSADQERTIFARLTGASSPYSIVQVRRRTSTHSWVDVAGGIACTGCAVEIGGQAGLAGKVVELEKAEGTAEWLFEYNRYKPPCSNALCVTVTGSRCGVKMTGATVTILQGGVTIGSGTTDSLGNFCLGGLAAGAYTVQVSKTGFTTQTVSKVIGSCETATVGVSFGAAAGFRELAGCDAAPTSATFSVDGITLTWNGISQWTGCKEYPNIANINDPCIQHTGDPAHNITWPVTYGFDGCNFTVSAPVVHSVGSHCSALIEGTCAYGAPGSDGQLVAFTIPVTPPLASISCGPPYTATMTANLAAPPNSDCAHAICPGYSPGSTIPPIWLFQAAFGTSKTFTVTRTS